LDLALSDEVRTQDAPYLVAGILARRGGCAQAWETIEQHWDELQERWPPNSFHRMLESVPALVAAPAQAERALAWLDAHPVVRGEGKVAQARERLEINMAFRKRVARQLTAALSRDT
jgi:puromycin-sensitive aminopeptidase